MSTFVVPSRRGRAGWLALLLFGSAVLTPGCHSDDPELGGSVIAIGAVIDQTGSLGRPGWRAAAELAVAHANRGLEQAGGFDEARFALHFSDSVNLPEVALPRATKLVRQRGVKALVTDSSSSAIALNETHYNGESADDLNVPIVCMACTATSLNNPEAAEIVPERQRALRDTDGWLFRTTADVDPEAVALLRTARELGDGGDTNGDGVWKLSVYVIDDAFGNSFFSAIQRARNRLFPLADADGDPIAGGLRLEVIRHAADVDANTYAWASDVELLLDTRNEEPLVNPDATPRTGEPVPLVVFDGASDAVMEATFPLFAASITRAYGEAGGRASTVPFIHHHNWRHDTTLVKLTTVDIAGQFGVSHALLDNCDGAGRAFQDALQAHSGQRPGIWDAQTYDAVVVLALAALVAAKQAGLADPSKVTGEQLRAALARVSSDAADALTVSGDPEGFAAAVAAIRDGRPINYQGASGPVDFDAQGNVRNNFVRYQVQNRRFVDEATFNCVADPEQCTVASGACSP